MRNKQRILRKRTPEEHDVVNQVKKGGGRDEINRVKCFSNGNKVRPEH